MARYKELTQKHFFLKRILKEKIPIPHIQSICQYGLIKFLLFTRILFTFSFCIHLTHNRLRSLVVAYKHYLTSAKKDLKLFIKL